MDDELLQRITEIHRPALTPEQEKALKRLRSDVDRLRAIAGTEAVVAAKRAEIAALESLVPTPADEFTASLAAVMDSLLAAELREHPEAGRGEVLRRAGFTATAGALGL